MKKIVIYSGLVSVFFVQILSTGCSSGDAHAESPCPTSFSSLEIKVLDSISGEEIKTAEVVVAGNIYEKDRNESTEREVSFTYNTDLEGFGCTGLETTIYLCPKGSACR